MKNIKHRTALKGHNILTKGVALRKKKPSQALKGHNILTKGVALRKKKPVKP